MNYDLSSEPDVFVTVAGVRTCRAGHNHGMLFTSLGWRVCDPQAIQFRVADAEGVGADWFFDRETLNEIVHNRPNKWTGKGVVNARIRSTNREQLKMRFRDPSDYNSYMDVVYYRPYVLGFVDRTYAVLTTEDANAETLTQLDAALAQMLG